MINTFIYLIFSITIAFTAETNKKISLGEIDLEKSTFADVIKNYGPSKMHKGGDAGNSLTWICYRTKDKKFLQFGSSEMGSDKYITEIILTSLSQESSRLKECEKTPHLSKNLKFSNGLSLKSTLNEAIALLGNAQKKNDEKYTYVFSKKIDNDLTELLTLELVFKPSLVHIYISKVTSN